MEIGGAERSLIGLLEALENKSVQVSVFLYRREGEFIKDLPQYVRLLPEIPAYHAYTEPISSLVKHGRLRFAAARLLAKLAFFVRYFHAKTHRHVDALAVYLCIFAAVFAEYPGRV